MSAMQEVTAFLEAESHEVNVSRRVVEITSSHR